MTEKGTSVIHEFAGTYVLLNHVQDKYLDGRNPEDVALRQKINDFVEEIRPHVAGIIWSYARTSDFNGNAFDGEGEKKRNPAFKEGDHEVTNNDGKGLDSGFLVNLAKINPGKIILAGLYFEACSEGTATTIKQGLGIPVAVPKDLTNQPEAPFEKEWHNAAARMEAAKIDVTSTSKMLLEGEKQAKCLQLGSGFMQPKDPETPATDSRFTRSPVTVTPVNIAPVKIEPAKYVSLERPARPLKL